MPSPGESGVGGSGVLSPGESLVCLCSLQEGRVWCGCALSRRGGSGVAVLSPGGEGLVCRPLQMFFLLSSLFTRGVALVNTNLISSKIKVTEKYSYRVTRMGLWSLLCKNCNIYRASFFKVFLPSCCS